MESTFLRKQVLERERAHIVKGLKIDSHIGRVAAGMATRDAPQDPHAVARAQLVGRRVVQGLRRFEQAQVGATEVYDHDIFHDGVAGP